MDHPALNPSDVVQSIRYDRTCPISNVSFEVLSYIFELAEYSFRSDFAPFVSISSTCGLSFSRVCKFWYAVALKTPCLWTSFAVRDDRSIRSAHKWFTRALSSSAFADVRVGPKEGGLTSAIAYQFLLDTSDRLERLRLDVHISDSPRYAWPLEWSSLVSLELVNVWTSWTTLCFILKSSPRLENLSIICHGRVGLDGSDSASSFFQHEDKEPFTGPLSLIRLRLEISAISQSELCELLDLCPVLEYLSLSYLAWFPSPTPLPKVDLPALVGASLPVSEFTEQLLGHWKAPLTRLTVFDHRLSCQQLHDCIIEGSVPWDTAYAIDFTMDDALTVDRFLLYLGRSPQTIRLMIYGCANWLDDILELICPPNESESGLPNLRDLAIMNCSSPCDFESFCERLVQRHEPLDHVYVRASPFVGTQRAARLLRMHGTRYIEYALEASEPSWWPLP